MSGCRHHKDVLCPSCSPSITNPPCFVCGTTVCGQEDAEPGRVPSPLDDLSTALDAAKDALRRARLDLAIRRDSVMTQDEQIAALDVYAEFGR